MFPLCKRIFCTPAWEACLPAAGKPVCPGKALTTPKYIYRHRISNMSICKPPFWKLGLCSCSAFSDNLLSKRQQRIIFNHTYCSMHESPSLWEWGSSIHGDPLKMTGKCSFPEDEAVQHPIWELRNHLSNLRQILNTSLFSIKMPLSP